MKRFNVITSIKRTVGRVLDEIFVERTLPNVSSITYHIMLRPIRADKLFNDVYTIGSPLRVGHISEDNEGLLEFVDHYSKSIHTVAINIDTGLCRYHIQPKSAVNKDVLISTLTYLKVKQFLDSSGLLDQESVSCNIRDDSVLGGSVTHRRGPNVSWSGVSL